MEKREHGFQGKQAGEAPWTLTGGSCTPGQGDGGKDRSPGDRQRSSEVNGKQSGGNAVWARASHSKHGPEAPSSVRRLTGCPHSPHRAGRCPGSHAPPGHTAGAAKEQQGGSRVAGGARLLSKHTGPWTVPSVY